MKTCGPNEAVALAEIYGRVFSSYAFPIEQSDYLENVIRKNGYYFAAYHQGAIVAAAALEVDLKAPIVK